MLDYFFLVVYGAVGALLLLIYFAFISSNKDVEYWWKYFKVTVLLGSYREKFQKKLPIYRRLKESDFSAIDVGLVPTSSEYEIENPCAEDFLHCDGVHFFGVGSGQHLIDVCINKIQCDVSNVWIYLKLSDGEAYRLPGKADSRKPFIDCEHSFYACGLQVKCLSPLRKWRISFNGLLQKCNPAQENEEESELVHVRFSFVWLAMSVAQELNVDFSDKNLARAFADASHDIGPKDMQCFHDMQNRYEQWGQLMGTVSVNGSADQEIYMWSCRTRILDHPVWEEETTFAKFYMYFLEGYPLKVETMSVKNFLSNYASASSISGLGGIEEITDSDINIKMIKANDTNLHFSYKKSNTKHKITMEFTGCEEIVYIGPNSEWKLILKPFKMRSDDGDNGFGIMHLAMSSTLISEYNFDAPPLLLKDRKKQANKNFILSLSDDDCKSSWLAGGKGCSLALLTDLANKISSFHVPKGFVITTTAFDKHIKSNSAINLAIQRLVDVSGEKITGDLKEECSRCIEEFQSVKLADELKDAIHEALMYLYESIENVRFSVRSSACGEDSEDLSAAGQMLTVLGIRGLNNIADAVVKCWASKFGSEAVQYSRQNGQPIRSSMAVVVQEMVPSEVSGVMFTVDPVTGDPSHPYITANYGLGESVVSSLAEPDTIILKKNADNSISIEQKIIGAKKSQIHMKVGEGTEEKSIGSETQSVCLSDEWSVEIGSIGILIENCFCAPRDIEWALYKDKFYLLQARPITTLHTETDFELIHDQDTPLRSENEYWTRANTGEVFPGATSPLGISLVIGMNDIFNLRFQYIREKLPSNNFCPYYYHIVPITHRQITLSVIDTIYRTNQKEISTFQKAFEIAIFGRPVGTKEIHAVGIKKYGCVSKWKQFAGLSVLVVFSYLVPRHIKVCQRKMKEYKLPVETFTTVSKTWKSLLDQTSFYNELLTVHGMCTFMGSIYNLIVITILAKGKEEWGSELYSDFATLLSACSGVESADVPESLEELAKEIAKNVGSTFSSLSVHMAYNTLMNDEGEAGKMFKDFFEKHGHRCMKEFDISSTSWGMDKESLIPILQNLVSSPNILTVQSKTVISSEEAVAKLNTPLNNSMKKILKHVLPRSRQAVRQREQSKSMIIKYVDYLRQTCRHLGTLMVEDGLLPARELIFFLTLDEIKEMIDTRKPGLVSKAVRRRRLHSRLDKIQFPEIIKGIPKPIDETEDLSNYSSTFTIKGIPVCQGTVRGTARVVTSLSEACTIQNGDILITYSTDVGWTPYFPLLSGVVTILGGLISHGAVVAREYGLPCVVGAQNAMSAFTSGDTIILDGTKGTITKIVDGEE